MDEYGAAFGFFPQLKPRRNINTDTSSLPLDVFRGRLAGLLGAPSDILNLLSSPKPMEVFGDVDYSPNPQLPYGSEQWLKELPLPPTSQAGNVLGKAASFVPLNPAPVIRGVQKAGQIAGEELAATMLGQRPNSLLDKVVPKPMFAVPPEQGLLTPAPVEPATSLLQTKPQAPVSDIGFYSAAEQAAMNIKRNAGPGQAMLNDILKGENVKADEIKWMGLDDFLRDKKNVTKQEVQDYIAQNRVDVQEVMLGGAQPYDKNRLAQLESEYKTLKQHPVDDPSFGEEKYDEMIRLMNIRDQSTTQSLYDAAEQATRSAQRAQRQGNNITAEKYFREAEFLNTRAEKLDLQGQGMSNPPKFGQYTLPGGENYREILLTMPFKEPAMPKGYKVTPIEYDDGTIKYFAETPTTRSAAYKSESDAQAELQRMVTGLKKFRENLEAYKSSHWDQPNVLAHIRVNDRVDADGKKMLLIEEVQSDWHQAGREKGYKSDVNPEENKALVKQWDTLANERRDLERIVAVGDDADPAVQSAVQRLSEISNELNAVNDRLTQVRTTFREGVPDAPFKDTWYQLALKRAMKYAADNGYDRIGLTTGARQAERYDLSKQVDSLLYSKNDDGTYRVSAQIQGRGQMLGESIPEAKLADYVGKEVAEKMAKGTGNRTEVAGNYDPISMTQGPRKYMTELSGDGLKVGGEGMKKYYDEIYPKFLDKYGKKWGAKVGETKIDIGDKAPSYGMPSIAEFEANRLDGEFMPDYIKRMKSIRKTEPIRYIDITPEMRTSTSKGQPLFSAAPLLPTTGLLADEEKRKELKSLLEY